MQAIPEDVVKVTTKLVDRACNSEFITESWQGKRTLAGALKTSTTATNIVSACIYVTLMNY